MEYLPNRNLGSVLHTYTYKYREQNNTKKKILTLCYLLIRHTKEETDKLTSK